MEYYELLDEIHTLWLQGEMEYKTYLKLMSVTKARLGYIS